VSGTILSEVADAAERAGSDRIRFTPYQKLIVLDVPDDKLERLIADLDALHLPARPSHWRQNLMACSGIEFCKLSFAETRKRSQALVPELEQRLADLNAQLDVPVTININGCPTRALARRSPISVSRVNWSTTVGEIRSKVFRFISEAASASTAHSVANYGSTR